MTTAPRLIPSAARPASLVPADEVWVRSVVDGLNWDVRNDLADRLLNVARSSEGEPIKSGPMRTVWRLRIDGHEFIVKRFRVPHWRAAARNALRGHQAQWEAGRIRLLMQHDVPTARLVAVATPPFGSLFGDSVLITESLVGAQPLDLVLSTARRLPIAVRSSLIEAVGNVVARLHEAGLVHHDLHAGNVLVRRGHDGWHVWLIDTTKLRAFHGGVTEHRRATDLTLLFQTTRFYCDDRDRLRFWKSYWRTRNQQSVGQVLPDSTAIHRQAQPDRNLLQRPRTKEPHRVAKMLLARAERDSRAILAGMDRRWAEGNHHQINVDTQSLRCRGLAWLGRDVIEQWRDEAAWTITAALIRERRMTPRGEVELIVLSRSPRRGSSDELPSSWARQGWEIGHALSLRGIPAVQPLMFVEPSSRSTVAERLVCQGSAGYESLRHRLLSLTGTAVERQRQRGEIGVRISRLLRAMHDAGFVHRRCHVDSFGVTTEPVPIAWEDLSEPNPLFGAMLWQVEQIEQRQYLSREVVCRSLASLVTSILEVCEPSRAEWLRWLRVLLPQNVRPRWKLWWREVNSHVRRVVPLRLSA